MASIGRGSVELNEFELHHAASQVGSSNRARGPDFWRSLCAGAWESGLCARLEPEPPISSCLFLFA